MHVPFYTAELATLNKQTHSNRALIPPIGFYITVSLIPPISWSAGRVLGVGSRQLPSCDLHLTPHLAPTIPPCAGALGSLLELQLKSLIPSQHDALIFMEI